MLQLKNVSIAYGKIEVVKNVSFDIKKGQTLAIIGKSGTGKSSLLNAIADFIPYTGKIERQGKMGFCFQNNSLFPFMTIQQNIAFGLGELSRKEKEIRIAYILEMIGLPELASKYPAEISGGQRQRVALGRAISYNPSVLLLDEPFSSLDLYTRDDMISWVGQIVQKLDISVILVTHYIDEALLLADTVGVMKNKRIEFYNMPFENAAERLNSRFTPIFLQQKELLQNSLQ